MSDFETEKLNIYEKHLRDIPEKVDTSHGDYVVPFYSRTVGIGDGFNEAEMGIEITIENEIEKVLVLLTSEIEDGERKIIDDVEDQDPLKRARKYATEIENGAYYGITDGKELHILAIDPDSRIEELRDIEKLPQVINAIIKEERRIKQASEFVDELKEFHGKLEPYVGRALRNKLEEDPDFRDRIRKFLVPIGMSYEEDEEMPSETLEMLSRQATYLLIDKILFYYLIVENEESLRESLENEEEYEEIFEGLKEEAPPIEEKVDEDWSESFWRYLREIFDLIKEIDYEPIFDPRTSPLNEITLEDYPSASYTVKELMDYLYRKEKLSHLFDGPLLAKLYEGLIPPELRWKWGQIYTPPEVTRLIAEWAIRDPDDEVLDPACGTGRFLISAYEKLADLKGVKSGEKHQEIINQIYGIDINQFPAHLATMSLVALNLQSITKKVNMDVRDFFRFRGGGQTTFMPKKSKVELTGQTGLSEKGGLKGQSKLFGQAFEKMDAIIMNPPYTRQEALGEDYKGFVRGVALSNIKDKGKVKMSKQASYYTYFITHGTKFLKEKGRFGMIIQNSWMDVGYGKDVQKFLLDNYKIKAIIGTQRYRLIRTADVNTIVVLLEKEKSSKKRDENRVKFVQLKRSPEWFEQNYGLKELLSSIEQHEKFIDEDLRIISKKQSELRKTNKWGRYIRAPDVFFDKIEGKLTKQLQDVTDVDLGLTSGCNKFFYLDQETISEWKIEDKFLRPLIKSPKECKKYMTNPEDLRMMVLDVQADKSELAGTNVLGYIKDGENQGVHKRPFFEKESKKSWYKKQMFKAPLLQPYQVNTRHFTTFNHEDSCIDKQLVCINPKEVDAKLLWAYLNSTLHILVKELFGRISFGQGSIQNSVTDVQVMPILDVKNVSKEQENALVKIMKEMGDRHIKTVFEEIGAENPEEVSLDRGLRIKIVNRTP